MSKEKLEDFITKEMVVIPDGIEQVRKFRDNKKWLSSNYQMSIPSNGKNQTQTVENISIDSFQISKYPVTNQLYSKILGLELLNEAERNQPKVNISWIDAIQFCNGISKYFGIEEYYLIENNEANVQCNPQSKGFRLPTEAEWQYTCKSEGKLYQYGDINSIAWCKENSNNMVHNVGEKQPNQWGLYDMLGNTWEWCWDLFNQETYGEYRVFRGGSFAEESRICGATTRRKSHPEFAIEDLGFRLAKSI
jgi:formylglycine-generating enzyme required for sulfatase activity